MADNALPAQDFQDFDPWRDSSAGDFNDPWSDPIEQRTRERRQIRRYQLGFAALGLGLVIASLFSVGQLITFLLRIRPVLMVLHSWEFYDQTAVVMLTVLGAGLLWGGWPDERWRRRSGLLLMMFLIDLVLWSIDYATTLGLSDVAFGHEPFRQALGHALGWAEFALIASLAAEMAATLGESKALDLGRAVRSLTTVGAATWFAYFIFRTDWSAPVWPLRERGLNLELLYLWLGSAFLSATVLIQVTMLTLYAGRTCARTTRALRLADDGDPFRSRSEAGWNDFHSPDRDRDNR